jgi:hypothetical protein
VSRVRREPVPYVVAVAELLRRLERVPCREPVPLVVLTEKPPERPDAAAAVGRPMLGRTAENPAPAKRLLPGERQVKSVADGRWVIVKPGTQLLQGLTPSTATELA